MSSAAPEQTFQTIADIIAETASVDRAKITPTAHVINDLGIDSLDFLDIVFEIDKRFGVKVPVEAWTEQVNSGKAPAEHFFVLGALCQRIDELVAAKQG
jgi:acyl carrier protein